MVLYVMNEKQVILIWSDHKNDGELSSSNRSDFRLPLSHAEGGSSVRGAASAPGIETSDIRRGHSQKKGQKTSAEKRKSDGYKTDAGNALNAREAGSGDSRRAGDPIPGTDVRDDW